MSPTVKVTHALLRNTVRVIEKHYRLPEVGPFCTPISSGAVDVQKASFEPASVQNAIPHESATDHIK